MIPPYVVDQLTYLIKQEGVKEVTNENFLKVVQYGTVKATHIESLLRVMMGIYAPIFFENTTWPDSILSARITNATFSLRFTCLNTIKVICFWTPYIDIFPAVILKTRYHSHSTQSRRC